MSGSALPNISVAALLDNDVPRVIASLLESAAEADVRGALQHCSITITTGEETRTFPNGPSPLSICEYISSYSKDGAMETIPSSRSTPDVTVTATLDMSSVFQGHLETGAVFALDTTVTGTLSSPPLFPPQEDTAHGVAGDLRGKRLMQVSMQRRMVRCVLLSRRVTEYSPSTTEQETSTLAASIKTTTTTEAITSEMGLTHPLTLKQLNLHIIDMRQPFEGLQSLLQAIYEPILRAQRDVALRSQIQDLVSAIRSRCQTFAEVDLRQLVHTDLLELCAANPLADVGELVEILGPDKSTDAAFLLQVLAVRNRCRAVLGVQLEGKEVTNARDEVAYWHSVLQWIEQTIKQLQSREWRLVHCLLSHRVETSYEVEFNMHAQLVREYLEHLHDIPFQEIETVEECQLATLTEEMFRVMMKPTNYPPQQSLRLLDNIVDGVVLRLAGFAARENVLRMNPPEAQLRHVREVMETLQQLQRQYIECTDYFEVESGHKLSLAYPSQSSLSSSPLLLSTQQASKTTTTKTTTLMVEIPMETVGHPLLSKLLSRVRQLWAFINEHFYYERALRRIFASDSLEVSSAYGFQTELASAFDRFAEAVEESGSLWDITTAGVVEFNRAITAYDKRLASLDERLALVIGGMLATAQEMSNNYVPNATILTSSGNTVSTSTGYIAGTSEAGGGPSLYRIYSRFRPLRREKIQDVVAGFQMALLEQTTREMKNVREHYFDVDRCRDAVRFSIARFGVTQEVGRMLWERSVKHEMEAYLVARDAISEHGWHQLLHLRTIEYRWCLNEQLAQFFGVPLADLVTKELHRDSELHGTAYALAYLDVLHAKDESEWSMDPHINTVKEYLQQSSPRSLACAKSRLLLIRVGQGRGGDQLDVRDARMFCDTITHRLQEKVVRWCEDVRRRIAALDVFPDSLKMKGPLLRLIVRPTRTPSGGGGAGGRGKGDGAGGTYSSHSSKRVVMPNIPREFFALHRDLHLLNGIKLLAGHVQLVSDVQKFFRQNEERLRIANCLTELIQACEESVADDDELLAHLVTDDYVKVHESLVNGARLRWSDEAKVQQFVTELSDHISVFSAAVVEVRQVTAAMDRGIQHLQENPYTVETLTTRLKEMYELVQRLISRCAGAGWWVRRVQPQLDFALSRQIEEHLHRWTSEFVAMGRDPRFLDAATETEEFKLRPLRVRMRVVFKDIALSTSIVACRNYWINELNRCLAWVHNTSSLLALVEPSSTGIGVSSISSGMGMSMSITGIGDSIRYKPAEFAYDRLMESIRPYALVEALRAIEGSLRETLKVESQWRRGQQLLNLELGVLQQQLGDDLNLWADALREIRDLANRQMDYTQPSTLVGGIVILADDAQKELGRKLDNLTQYIHSRYRDLVERQMEECYRSIMEDRTAAENCNVIHDLDDAARFLCELPTTQSRLKQLEHRIAPLAPAEDHLRRHGFTLPETWIPAKRVRDEFRAYSELVESKIKSLEYRRPFLRESAKTQEDGLRRSIDELEHSLKSVDTAADDATLGAGEVATGDERGEKMDMRSRERRVVELQERAASLTAKRQRLVELQEALTVPCMTDARLESIVARAEELHWVCGHIARAYDRLVALGCIPFFEMIPRRLHDDLVALEQEIHGFPDGVRSHATYHELERAIEKRMGCRRLMQELRSDAMAPLVRAERHWAALRTQLQTSWRLEELTVQDVWSTDPLANAKIYQDILEFAHGERRLETQLNHIISFWNDFEFNTTIYQGQFVLLRGWDVVFERLADDANSFQGMRASPFFTSQHVISTATDWETRLNHLKQILEVLMAVQRRWIHLDGIFTGNKEVRKQLPNDAIQFDRASREFMGLVPAKAAPLSSHSNLGGGGGGGGGFVLKAQDFLEDKRLLASLERLDAQLSLVQRALSAYLDRQRQQFPRFFFVGDDDLLETLGNSGKPALISKHLPKMFTAIANLTFSEDGTHVVSFSSAEGEEVVMTTRVKVGNCALHEWLSGVESCMAKTLLHLTVKAVAALTENDRVTPDWTASFPLQVVCLAFQVWWVRLQEEMFTKWQKQLKQEQTSQSLEPSRAVAQMVKLLDRVALDVVSPTATKAIRRAAEELITIAVYQRDVSRRIESKRITFAEDFQWLRVLRLYLSETELQCHMADASFRHGFEYLGWYQRLVQTTLTDRCYLTMTQALHTRLGGSPVGPAGSGKTETVKALGTQLGRHVLVFNCDDVFDFDAIGRIFLGLCRVGAWGCFDEFNRLEERVLSAVSQQIQLIQEALRAQSQTVTLTQHTVPIRDTVALFITMNPGFAGRSNLPGNLKQLFRTMIMAAPDRETIAEVMLFAQGFRTAESLSRKIVPLFHLCEEQLSRQAHYDFGLRALKSVLVAAGGLKRRRNSTNFAEEMKENEIATTKEGIDGTVPCNEPENLEAVESELVLRSLISNVIPRLVTEDAALFAPLLRDFFPDSPLPVTDATDLQTAIDEVCRESGYAATPAWVEKICQLFNTRQMRHGLMLVGPSGTGKTACWRTLLRAMARLPYGALEAHAYVIDPKAMTKAELFGVFEATTREWKDGVFTEILRRIVNNDIGDDRAFQQHWIIFDGDVDPNWVENLNSLLDDNKVYTLPNGERLSLPPSVRIVFEVQHLRYATPATVSRCGMVWFSRGTVPASSVLDRMMRMFHTTALIDRRGRKRLDCLDDYSRPRESSRGNYFFIPRIGAQRHLVNIGEGELSESFPTLTQQNVEEVSAQARIVEADRALIQLQTIMAHTWAPAFSKGGKIEQALQLIQSETYRIHAVMEPDDLQILRSLLSLLIDALWRVWKKHYQEQQQQQQLVPIEVQQQRVMELYALAQLDYAVLWSFGAALSHNLRVQLATDLGLTVPDGQTSLLDFEVDPSTGGWFPIRTRVQSVAVRAEQVGTGETVVPTVDTCRHEDILHAWISGGSAAVLCGPPGSGKTMSITSILGRSTEYDAVFLNFSSGTRPDTVIRALEQYCTLQNGPRGPVLSPASGKRLLLFCDEINLPALDTYGTQPVVQLLRQLVERGGYYRGRDNAWVTVEGVQIIGACNPPTDAGRVSLSHRFLRWAPVLFVNFPTEESLHIIYTAYCTAILAASGKMIQAYAPPLARAMVAMYTVTQSRLTPWQQPHYVYSPRELTRWTRAIYEALLTWDETERCGLTVDGLLRLAVHEGLRVFQDRLVEREACEWTDTAINKVFMEQFPKLTPASLRRPLLFSTILHRAYSEGSREALRVHIEERLATFCEEEMDAPLVVYDAMIDHVTRINRVLRQPLGHMLLAGASGVGKTITARLVAWMNGLSVFRLGVHRNYQLDDYENDLRDVLRRAGCKLERICFIFDDSNILEASFLEYMNALLASGEVPGLFDGEEWTKLMDEIRESVSVRQQQQQQQHKQQQQGVSSSSLGEQYSLLSAVYVDIRSEQELYRWFLGNVRRNLHIVFTINPSSGEFASRAVASPALFNRCTIDWFGDWDRETRYQLTQRLTKHIDIMFSWGGTFRVQAEAHDALANVLCQIHDNTTDVNRKIRLQNAHSGTFVTPRHFGDFVRQLQLLYEEKRGSSTEQLSHLRSGLSKLDATSEEVEQQRAQLRTHETDLAKSSVAAQQMLDRIVNDTEVTKQEKAAAERLRVQLREEEEIILVDKSRVERQLAAAEPALREAAVALNTIRPEYLREIRAYATPPPMVKRVLEAVLAVMGETRADEWDVIKHHIRRDDFLAGVKAFQPRSVTAEAVVTVRSMLAAGDFTREAAYRASKAAGPLLLWVEAQVKYAEIARAIEPMRVKVEQLTEAHTGKQRDLAKTESEIVEKETALRKLKENYQAMTEKMAEIKGRMAGVAARCERATTLLRQLLDERERWENESRGFDTEVQTVLGDCVLAAAALAYFGYFDEHTRQSLLLPRWRERLQELRVPFREALAPLDLLVAPQERLKWEHCGLPTDKLYVENAMILARCQRYPLLIDPSGLAASFLLQRYAREKINKASFSKAGYLKQLDMAVRFGYPILMEDAEFIDPALSPLINHEFHRTGGHMLTRLGAQDVDVAPTFKLFLVTRDSNYQPSPGMAGQVCLVNFTVTESSLQSQCHHRVMLHERVELDARRTRILQVQGEYHLRLRVLEQELLTTIARSEGSLLENDSLTVALERLKDETRALHSGIAESEISMQTIATVEAHYQPLATAAAKIYFALRKFSQLHGIYRFNADFILKVIADSLVALPPRTTHLVPPNTSGDTDMIGRESDTITPEDLLRLEELTRRVFNLAHHRARRAMFARDHLVLALVMGRLRSTMNDAIGRQISLEEWGVLDEALQSSTLATHEESEEIGDDGMEKRKENNDHIYRNSGNNDTLVRDGYDTHDAIPPILHECGVVISESALVMLLRHPPLALVRQSLLDPTQSDAWKSYFASNLPRAEGIPIKGNLSPTRRAFFAALLLFHTRRDAFAPAASEFLRRFFDGPVDNEGQGSDKIGNGNIFLDAEAPDLAAVQSELSDRTPLILVANAGNDPAVGIEALARSMDVPLRVVAMGSATGLDTAGRYLDAAMADGSWVLFKNMHLARAYAAVVEKRIHRERAEGRLHHNFRLILSVESAEHGGATESEELPASLVEVAVVLVYEPPPGMKSSLLQTIGALRPLAASTSKVSSSAPTPSLMQDSSLSLHAAQPPEVQRIYLAAAWLHAVVMERLLYVPMGWSTHYEFTDTEFWRILQSVDRWVLGTGTMVTKITTTTGGGMQKGSKVDRTRVPWTALRTIIGTTLYGGKISNAFDQLLLDSFCTRLMSAAIFESDAGFSLVGRGEETDPALRIGPIESLHDAQSWARALPESCTPQWARLPASAPRVVQAQHAVTTLERLAALRLADEVNSATLSSSTSATAAVYSNPPPLPPPFETASPTWLGASTSPATPSAALSEVHWAQSMRRRCRRWCAILVTLSPDAPVVGTAIRSPSCAMSDEDEPMAMAVRRECTFAASRRRELLDDLRGLEAVCDGTQRPTAAQRVLLEQLRADQLPPRWARGYQTPPTTAEQWMADFTRRATHAQRMREALGVSGEALKRIPVALGLLFWPGAFLTATKQQAGRRQRRSLEQLQPRLLLRPAPCTTGEDHKKDSKTNEEKEVEVENGEGWELTGLTLYAARVVGTRCEPLSATAATPSTAVTAWLRWESSAAAAKSSLFMRLAAQDPAGGRLATPLYMNPQRDTMLEVVELQVESDEETARAWYERGVCLTAWSFANA